MVGKKILMDVHLMSLLPIQEKSIILILDVEGRTAQHLMNEQLIENFQNPDLGVALDLSINPNHTETMIENVVHPGPSKFINI